MTAVCLVSGNHLCNNPRVLKAADALDAAGYRVQVLGAALDAALVTRDETLLRTRRWTYVPVVDLTTGRGAARHRSLRLRARWRTGRALAAVYPFNAWQLGYCTPELLEVARQTDADLYIAHSEQALWAVAALAAEERAVGVDFEDWYSEDGWAAEGDRPRALLRRLESELLAAGVHATCPSFAMSRAIAEAYDCDPPTVVHNTFAWSSRALIDGKLKDRRDRALPSIHWYSQTVGRERGLEELMLALPLLERPVELHLRGVASPAVRQRLVDLVPAGWRERVHFHPPVANDELPSRIAEHDIGFAGETGYCPSRDVTITNKLMDYLLAGLAVVASDTTGQREVAAATGRAVTLYAAGDPRTLAAAIGSLLACPVQLAAARRAALAAAEHRYSWEHDRPVLVGAVRRACARVDRSAARVSGLT